MHGAPQRPAAGCGYSAVLRRAAPTRRARGTRLIAPALAFSGGETRESFDCLDRGDGNRVDAIKQTIGALG